MKNHIVRDKSGKNTILYEDRDKRWILIPGRGSLNSVTWNSLSVLDKNYLEEEEMESLDLLPSTTILGIEAKSSLKYDEHNVNYTNIFLLHN